MVGVTPTAGNPAFTVDWLLSLLEARSLISAGLRRDLEVKAPAQRARVALQHAKEQGDSSSAAAARYQVSPVELIASFGLTLADGKSLGESELGALVADAVGLSFHKIDPLALDMALVTRTLSRPFALRHVVLPIAETATELTVAIENPFDQEVVESLKRIARRQVRRVVAAKKEIVKALTEIYGFRKSVESAARESGRQSDPFADFEQLVRLRNVGEIEASDQHVVNAVDFLLRYAFDQRASDIHLEPKKGDAQVRLRIDGVLHNTHTIPRAVVPAMVSRVKTLSRMDIAEKRRPQDGRIKTMMGEREVELRVSTLPTAFGEKVVIRIFDPENLLQDLPDLGFDASDLAVFKRWIDLPHGLVLITGPTGSGKTTTLYATLKTLADESVNVTTVEDPIEMITDRFNQTAAQPKIGLDFPDTMRAILRQDPDIIMVGEIRDKPTAEMAVQAALTGHLVLSTLHTNDSVGAITRLQDLGVPPFLIASSVIGVMAQRLVRRICKDCKRPAPLSAQELLALGIREETRGTYAGTMEGAGCVTCRGTGYYGRVGIFEMLDLTPALAALVTEAATELTLRQAALGAGMRTLRACALERLALGLTTAEEVVKVTGIELPK
ncbi:MAG: type II/IV secretion system protein [Deltaproteobacteria bacterium]|nr:type II/IV secretion system protein [Deltaproteobacteria bacterium]